MNNSNNTARNFALQLGSLITLYVTLTAVIIVIFGVVDILRPDPASSSWEYDSAQQSIRMGIAMLFVFFPAFLAFTRFVNKIRRNETGTYLSLTKWVVYLSLLLGGCVLLGDVVTVILAYLNGEITIRFVLKAGALAVVLGFALYYYILDARGHWNTHEKQSKLAALVACVIIAFTLALGFMHSDSPTKVHEMKIDAQQVSDLSDMQWRIEDHYRINKALPIDIKTVYVGIDVPKAAFERDAYKYKTTADDKYELCATFAYSSKQNTQTVIATPVGNDVTAKNPYNNWDHGTGVTCFERTIQKELTPVPILKQ